VTQADAALMIGITTRTYEKYEGDPKRNIPVKSIARFCLVSGVDPEWILLGRNKQQRQPRPVPAVARTAKKIKRVA
jgi:hypothetical protein